MSSFKEGTITLPPSFEELGVVKFKELVKVDYSVGADGIIYFTWDCGMDGVPIPPDSKWCGLDNLKSVKKKILRSCQYDLAHAFFHYEGDPNFTHYHWALRAIYSKQAVIEETSL